MNNDTYEIGTCVSVITNGKQEVYTVVSGKEWDNLRESQREILILGGNVVLVKKY